MGSTRKGKGGRKHIAIERRKKANNESMNLETISNGTNLEKQKEKQTTSSNNEVHKEPERGERNEDRKSKLCELRSKDYDETKEAKMTREEFFNIFGLKDQEMIPRVLVKLNTLSGFELFMKEEDKVHITSTKDSEYSVVYQFKQGIMENRVAEIMAYKALEDRMETLEKENKNKGKTHIDKSEQIPRSFDAYVWDDEFTDILIELAHRKLGIIFKKAIKTLEVLGHSEELATKAVLLSTSLCYNGNDLVMNIVENCLKYMKKKQRIDVYSASIVYLDNLEQLEMCVLDELVSLILTFHTSMSKVEATWHLLLCDFQYTRALSNICDEKLSSSSPLSVQLQSQFDDCKSQLQNQNETSSSHCSTSGEQVLDENSPFIVGELTRDYGIHFRPIPESSNLEQEVASVSGRYNNKGTSKRNTVIKQKLVQATTSRTHGSNVVSGKQAVNLNKMLDKKLTSGSDTVQLNSKDASLMMKSLGINVSQAHQTLRNSVTPLTVNLKPVSAPSGSFMGSTGRASKTASSSSGPASKPTSSSNGCASKATNSNSGPSSKSASSSTGPASKSASSSTERAGPAKDNSYELYDQIKMLLRESREDNMIQGALTRKSEVEAKIQSTTDTINEKVMEIINELKLTKAEGETLKQGKEETLRVQKRKQLMKEEIIKKTILRFNDDLDKYAAEYERITGKIEGVQEKIRGLNKVKQDARLEAAEAVANSVEAYKKEKIAREVFESTEEKKIPVRNAYNVLVSTRKRYEDKVDRTKTICSWLEHELNQETNISAKLEEELIKLTTEEDDLGKSIDGSSSKGGKKMAKRHSK